jgi:fused signal recognition particle receptor
MSIFDFFKKDKTSANKSEPSQLGLDKTKESFFGKLGKALAGRASIDASFLDELEEILISSDVGTETTFRIIDRVEKRVKKYKYLNSNELHLLLRDEITLLLTENKKTEELSFNLDKQVKPYVLMVVGVNGVGKTTTIGKLANQFKKHGNKVLLAAGDTFRAGAVDQLEIWSKRVGCDFYS